MKKSESKLKRPEAVVDASTGRRTYTGSIADMSGGEPSKAQKTAIMEAIKDNPKFSSGLVIEGISPLNPHSQQGLSQFLQSLSTSGLATFSGKVGWGLTEKGREHLKNFGKGGE